VSRSKSRRLPSAGVAEGGSPVFETLASKAARPVRSEAVQGGGYGDGRQTSSLTARSLRRLSREAASR